MYANNLLTDNIIPLRVTDKGRYALEVMNDMSIKHLPVVENGKLLGIISEDDIWNLGIDAEISSINFAVLPKIFVRENNHVYEVMARFAEYFLSAIPVIDEKDNYVGLILQEDLIKYFASTGSFSEPGSILVLEIKKQDYSLAEISRIIESENAAVLNSCITSKIESSLILVTLKINRQNIQDIIASFRRHNYEIKGYFDESEYLDVLKERYDSLMTFLKV